MGTIRTLLAISVVFAHTYGFVFVGGRLAVQSFYLISGFLISYILVERKSYTEVSKFYFNRGLRLFPIYLVVAVMTLGMYIAGSFFVSDVEFFQVYKTVPLAGQVSLTLSNIFIFGQDWIMFTGVQDGVFQFVTDHRNSEVPVYEGLLIPQAWTLGVELSFYLIAPFILKNRAYLILLLVMSLALRAYLISTGLGLHDPWTYRFFPTELALFIFGALSHQFFRPLCKKYLVKSMDRVSVAVTVFIAVYCTLFFLLPYRNLNGVLLLGMFMLALPFLFHFQSNKTWDRKIGDLSYPIYISHMLVIWPVTHLFKRVDSGNSIYMALMVIAVTIVISFALERCVNAPIESVRSKLRRKAVNPQQVVVDQA